MQKIGILLLTFCALAKEDFSLNAINVDMAKLSKVKRQNDFVRLGNRDSIS